MKTIVSKRKNNNKTQGTVANTVYRTNSYEMFGYIDGNREVNRTHIDKLKTSLAEKQLPVPIVVDGLYRIHDGQHRFEAIKELGLPIYYIVLPELGVRDVQLLNATMKAWNYNDYAHSYIMQGNDEYRKFLEFRETYGFGVRESLQLLIGDRTDKNVETNFKLGNRICHDENGAIEKAMMINELAPYHDRYRTRAFVNALNHCFSIEGYDHKRFVSKVKRQSLRLTDQVTHKEYLVIMEKIYNSGVRKANYFRLAEPLTFK